MQRADVQPFIVFLRYALQFTFGRKLQWEKLSIPAQ
jgi:hypothetical protein